MLDVAAIIARLDVHKRAQKGAAERGAQQKRPSLVGGSAWPFLVGASQQCMLLRAVLLAMVVFVLPPRVMAL